MAHQATTIDREIQRNMDILRQLLLEESKSDTRKSFTRRWTNEQDFFEDVCSETYVKLPTLPQQIWGKVVFMEMNRRVGKLYLRQPSIVIDGSDFRFDGQRVGLSSFQNLDRMKIAYEIFDDLLRGVTLKIDSHGNIWAKKTCHCPVFLKPLYRTGDNFLFHVEKDFVKVFDIYRFKKILLRELRQEVPDRRHMEKCSMVCLQFSSDSRSLLRAPCWIVLINLVAIELVNIVIPADYFISTPASSFIAGPASKKLIVPKPSPAIKTPSPFRCSTDPPNGHPRMPKDFLHLRSLNYKNYL